MDYEVKVSQSSRELTGKQKIQAKDTADCVRLDKATQENPSGVLIDIDYWVKLDIHNEHSEDKDYSNYVLVDKDGTRYVTGSNTFWTTFANIWSDMFNEEEEWKLKVFRLPSRNRAGKDFITCSIV